uniref:cytochrome c oxidase subunit II n=1 Tax=Neoplerochila paliatseasi TaxID=2704509 RepID=UPI0013E982BD|nr:cytochrome c oxidase subunit II [Neoplerochila paliatseasi]QHR79414.1 cytochrome c oxidase subunit II [Neoplerochila paliatseasi]
MPMWSQINLQEANSPLMEQLIFFHDHTLMILIMITVMVTYIMSSMMFNKLINKSLLESQKIELIWTILPAVTLIFIALPSLRILYLMDEINEPLITIKSIGHQWFWSYEYSDFKNVEFDSYMKPTNELLENEFRLLDVDNRVVLPINTPTRILITSADVIHSWTIPSLGIKIDATPGRLNQGTMFIKRPTLMFGQCSEICGVNHSFMPIVVESTSMNMFINWIKNF